MPHSAAELELSDKYADAFAAAGYDDERLRALCETIDEEGAEEAAAEVDEMIAAVGLKGGSSIKVRRLLPLRCRSTDYSIRMRWLRCDWRDADGCPAPHALAMTGS